MAHGDLIAAGVLMIVLCTIGVCSLPNTDKQRKQRLAWNVFKGIAEGKIVQFRRKQCNPTRAS